jgi:YaiO family outer membrane protein
VIGAAPGYADARDALIDVERWSGNLIEALRLCDEGIATSPNIESFRNKRALVLEAMNDLKEATATVKKLLAMNSGHAEAKVLLERLEYSKQEYKLTLDYAYDVFDKTFDPWHQVSVSLNRQLSLGPLIGRLNYAHRFGRDAVQYEVDFYPRIRRGTYLYLNAGYSANSIFPEYRLGSEVYQSLPRSYEASLGFRRLQFPGSGVTIYTGSLGKYYRNYWFSFRPYVTPSSIGASASYSGTVRIYLDDADRYFTFSAGAGSFPDERNTTLDTFRLRTAKVSVDGRFRMGRGLFGTATAGFDTQEITRGNRRNHFNIGFSLEKTF